MIQLLKVEIKFKNKPHDFLRKKISSFDIEMKFLELL